MQALAEKSEQPTGRILGFDALRGFSVLSMVLFHFCYDLTELSGVSLSWFKPPFEDIWRASISWCFLLIAGCMCNHSRNNLKRALEYLALALAIFLVTFVTKIDTPISFGIIYCMGFSTLVYALIEKLRARPRGYLAAGVLFACFVLTLHAQTGTLGVGEFRITLPQGLFKTEYLSWLGFPGPHFTSGDYYPPLPYSLLFLSGACLGDVFKDKGYPGWFCRLRIPLLNLCGRHPLLIYVLHQPVLLGVSMLVANLVAA